MNIEYKSLKDNATIEHWVILLLFVALILNLSSCTNKEKALKQHFLADSSFVTKRLILKDKSLVTKNNIDSLYATFPYISVVDKNMYYQFWLDEMIRLSQYEKGHIYADSMLYLLTKNRLETTLVNELANVYFNKSLLFSYQRNNKQAIISINLATELMLKNGNFCKHSSYTNHIGLVQFSSGNYSSAAQYLLKAMKIGQKCNDNKQKIQQTDGQLDNLGLCFYKMKKYNLAIKFYFMALKNIEKNLKLFEKYNLNADASIANIFENLAHTYFAKGEYQKALEFRQKNISISKNHNFWYSDSSYCYLNLAEIHLALNHNKEAETLLDELNSYLGTLSLSNKQKYYLIRSNLEKNKNRISGELSSFKKYTEIKDSLNTIKFANLKFDPQLIYDQNEKELKLRKLDEQNQLNKVIIYSATIILLLVSILLYSALNNIKKHKKNAVEMSLLNTELKRNEELLRKFVAEKEAIRELQIQNELNMQNAKFNLELKSKLLAQRSAISDDMHDGITSSIIALQYYIMDLGGKAENDRIKAILETLLAEVKNVYANIREYIHNLKKDTVKIKYDFVSYLKEIAKNFKEKGLIKINLDLDEAKLRKSLNDFQVNHLNLFVNEVINNAIKHSNASELNFSFRVESKVCNIKISDNGVGISLEKSTDGLGLRSIKNRFEVLGGEFNYLSTANGLEMTCSFPLD
jgi:signal transduction histidine kinase